MFRSVLACGGLAWVLFAAGCGQDDDTIRTAMQVRMGETARLGALAYTVTEVEWLDQLGAGAGARLPEHRFLSVRMSVTNGGARRFAIPNAELLDSRGEPHPELVDASDVPEWFGALRTIEPGQTEHGRIVFDVPIGAYRLKVMENAEPGQAQAALIDIPYQPHSLLPGQGERPLPRVTQ